jgi:hypothetical protein
MGALIEGWRRLSMHPAIRPWNERRIVLQWKLTGRQIPPPPVVKHAILREYAARFGLRTFVETGTFAGDTIDAVLYSFDRIVSIELSDAWHSRAKARFSNQPHVTLVQGDSGNRLPEVLATLEQPALFWLDAHYSGPTTARAAIDTPIGQELESIAKHPVRGHVVLIDDLREFTGQAGYPTEPDLVAWMRRASPAMTVESRDDILRWTPRVS